MVTTTTQVLVRLCDHVVIWAAQGLVRAAVAGRHPLDQGQILRLRACRDTLSEALKACSGGEGDDGGSGGGLYGRRLEFLDDLIEMITVADSELEGDERAAVRFFFFNSLFTFEQHPSSSGRCCCPKGSIYLFPGTCIGICCRALDADHSHSPSPFTVVVVVIVDVVVLVVVVDVVGAFCRTSNDENQ